MHELIHFKKPQLVTVVHIPVVQEGSSSLESRKFLPLMYQLAARMSARQAFSDFQKILQEVSCIMFKDYSAPS